MIRRISIVVVVLAALLVPGLTAIADGVSVTVQSQPTDPIISSVPLSQVGDTAYTTQQDLYGVVDSTGAPVSNSYLDVCVNGACVPVDPYSAGN